MSKDLTFSRTKSQAMFHLLPGGLIDHPREGIMKVKNWSSTRVTQTIYSKNRLAKRINFELAGSNKDTAFSMINNNTIQFFEPSSIVLELFPLVFYNRRTKSHIAYEPGETGLAKMEEDIRKGKVKSGELIQEDLVFVARNGELAQIYIPSCKLHPAAPKRLVKPAGRGQESYYWHCEGCNGRYQSFFYGNLGGEKVINATPVRDPSAFRPRIFSIVNAPHDLPTNEVELAEFEQAILAQYMGYDGTLNEIAGKVRSKKKKYDSSNKDMEELEKLIENMPDSPDKVQLRTKVESMKSKDNVGDSIRADIKTTFGLCTEDDFRNELDKIDSIYEFLYTSKADGITLNLDNYEYINMPVSKYRDFRRRLDKIAVRKLYYSSNIPIMTVSYGYTRGTTKEDSFDLKVRAFPPDTADSESGVPPVYVNQIETEGLVLEFDRDKIARWLKLSKLKMGEKEMQENELRGWFFNNVDIKKINSFKGTEDADQTTSMIFTLIHSISHSLIKELAVEAGLDTSSLGERIFPAVPAVLIYSNESTGSTIGFLRDVFTNKIRPWIDNAIARTYRCIYDPVCQHQGGACHYCMYLHEASCEFFNKSLNRNMLIGWKEGDKLYMPFWSITKDG